MTTKLSRFLVAVGVLVAGLMGMTAPVSAQMDKGSIAGVVQDQSNANIKGAIITVRNERTGDERMTETKDDGSFSFPVLMPSMYAITASAPGFATAQITGRPLTVGQELRQNFTLHLASVSAEVTVTSGAEAPIDTTSARIGVNVTEREVGQLPINGRQLSQLYLQAPGSVNAGTGTFQDIRFSGRSVEQNAVRYDGIEGSAIIDAAPGNLNGEISAPAPFRLQASLENVQEFRVESNNYPAEYGTGTGGQVSVVTKSGSNAFHGGVYEYLRNDALDAKNTFDLVNSKSKLRLNQFGASVGGPLVKDKLFFFGYFEGYRLRAGINNIESAPSTRITSLPACTGSNTFANTSGAAKCVWADSKPFLAGFVGPGAVLVKADTTTGDPSNSSLDAYLLPGVAKVSENSFGVRLDYHINNQHSFYVRYFRDQGQNSYPEGITGRQVFTTAIPQNGVISLTSLFGSSVVNELKFGFNAAKTRINSTAPTINGIDYSLISINTSGSVALPGISGQTSSAGLAVPGGLIRANSATNGRAAPYTPYTMSFVDNISWTTGIHTLKFGGEARLIRMYTDRLGGTTYSFSNLSSFLSGTINTVDNIVDLGLASPFNAGATGERYLKQEYYIAYVQDEIKVRPNLTLNAGLRYEFYSALREENNLYVQFDLDNGTLYSPKFCQTPLGGVSTSQSICPTGAQQWYKANPGNFGPRVGIAWSPFASRNGMFGGDRSVFRAGFGIFYGPGQTEDLLQPAESDRIWSTPSGGTFCGLGATCTQSGATNTKSPAALTAGFLSNPNDRAARVRAYAKDYVVPEMVYQYSASWQQQWAGFVSTFAYVGSRGRNLFLRNVGNRVDYVRTNTTSGSAVTVRQFDVDCSGVASSLPTVCTTTPGFTPGPNAILHPYAEIDYKTSGGYDAYNALQMSLLRRFSSLTISGQYTYAKSFGNSSGSNDARTTGNPNNYDYDLGYNLFDVRHSFNVSALYRLPFGKGKGGIVEGVIGNWEVGTIVSARSGLPVEVQITRPDVIYRGLPGTSVAGQYLNGPILNAGCLGDASLGVSAGICTQAIINTPGGGNSRNVRRPDLVPGVPIWLENGDLNPAAFAIPMPGTYGNLQRGSIHGPSFYQADFTLGKKFPITESMNLEFRTEIFNILNHPNKLNPPSQLGNILSSSAGGPQPGQAYTLTGANSAGAFGKIISTVGQTVGTGTNRQIQFALRLNF